ncbi:hypothetical protein [Microbacterium sp. GXF0217]
MTMTVLRSISIDPATPSLTVARLREAIASMPLRLSEQLASDGSATTLSASSPRFQAAAAQARKLNTPVLVTEVTYLTVEHLEWFADQAASGAPVGFLLDHSGNRIRETADQQLRGDRQRLTLATCVMTHSDREGLPTEGMLVEQLALLDLFGLSNFDSERTTLADTGYVAHGRFGTVEANLTGIVGGSQDRIELHLFGADVHWRFAHQSPRSAQTSELMREDADGRFTWPSAYETTARDHLVQFHRTISNGEAPLVDVPAMIRYRTIARDIARRGDRRASTDRATARRTERT